jgi:hypothetical protein
MRQLLWDDERVRLMLLARGYDANDIVGGSLDDGQTLSVYVAPLSAGPAPYGHPESISSSLDTLSQVTISSNQAEQAFFEGPEFNH